MTTPRNSSAYPRQMLEAVTRAVEAGELVIPSKNPGALLLQYNGLRSALRRENAAEIIEMVSFHKGEGTFTIRLKENADYAQEIEAALKGTAQIPQADQTPRRESAEEAFERLMAFPKFPSTTPTE